MRTKKAVKPKHTALGRQLIGAAQEMLAHGRGEISLPMKKFDHTGSSFDSFLEEQGIKADVEATAARRVEAWKRKRRRTP